MTAPSEKSLSTATSPGAPLLDEVAAGIDEISSIPAVALRVMEVAADPESGAADLRTVVEADPALCVRVLRCVNSAAYGLRTGVNDLTQAVSYLGFNQIRDLAITASVSDLFKSSSSVGTYQRADLWKHMVAVAVCARMIAVRTKLEDFVNAFLAGLLHDVGIILLDQNCHHEFKRVIMSLNSANTLAETERRLLGWDHTELGFRIGSKWKLPGVVLSGIRHHHEPEAYTDADASVVHCVAIANLICSLKNMTSVGSNLVRLAPASLEALKLNKTDLKILAEDLDKELELNKHLFDIQQARR